MFSLLPGGCSRNNADPHRARLINACARLTLLHEREKIALRIPDSLYQTKVSLLFDSLKMTQEEFRSGVGSQTQTNTAWKAFMADVQHEMLAIQKQRDQKTSK